MAHQRMVIVADDDEPMRATLVEAIGDAFSVRVVGAENGQRVLDLVRRARPDAIVLDMQMPVLGGLDTARRLKADPAAAGIPLLAISGEAARAEALASGFADFFRKPFDLRALLEAVGKAIVQPA